MQNVPLSGRARIHAGAKVLGHVLVSRRATPAEKAQVTLTFDTVLSGKRRIPVTTNLRALASMMEVSQAQVPESGSDHGTSEYDWTTDQFGGEVAYHGGGVITHGSEIVGVTTVNGVLVHVASKPGARCGGAFEGNDRLQALWVFLLMPAAFSDTAT